MAAPKGNQFWNLRGRSGRHRKYTDPNKLWEDCLDYFQWARDNPLLDMRVIAYQGEGYDHPTPKMRAMSVVGLCNFLGISNRAWTKWKAEREDLVPIMEDAERVIYQQKFEGAAADLLNANIIARDLGLKDRTDVTSDDKPIESVKVHYD